MGFFYSLSALRLKCKIITRTKLRQSTLVRLLCMSSALKLLTLTVCEIACIDFQYFLWVQMKSYPKKVIYLFIEMTGNGNE